MDHSDFERPSVTIPTGLFKLLLQIAIAHSDFNQKGYLGANLDVTKALEDGVVDNVFLHYIGFGYFEGRLGATPEVDEKWYLRTYPDVAVAVRSGKIASAAEHFETVGAGEGRSPGPEHVSVADQWKRAILAK